MCLDQILWVEDDRGTCREKATSDAQTIAERMTNLVMRRETVEDDENFANIFNDKAKESNTFLIWKIICHSGEQEEWPLIWAKPLRVSTIKAHKVRSIEQDKVNMDVPNVLPTCFRSRSEAKDSMLNQDKGKKKPSQKGSLAVWRTIYGAHTASKRSICRRYRKYIQPQYKSLQWAIHHIDQLPL